MHLSLCSRPGLLMSVFPGKPLALSKLGFEVGGGGHFYSITDTRCLSLLSPFLSWLPDVFVHFHFSFVKERI